MTGRPDEMRVMWKTHSRSCPTKVHYGEGIVDEAGFASNAATMQNSLVSIQVQCKSTCLYIPPSCTAGRASWVRPASPATPRCCRACGEQVVTQVFEHMCAILARRHKHSLPDLLFFTAEERCCPTAGRRQVLLAIGHVCQPGAGL